MDRQPPGLFRAAYNSIRAVFGLPHIVSTERCGPKATDGNHTAKHGQQCTACAPSRTFGEAVRDSAETHRRLQAALDRELERGLAGDDPSN